MRRLIFAAALTIATPALAQQSTMHDQLVAGLAINASQAATLADQYKAQLDQARAENARLTKELADAKKAPDKPAQ